MTKNRVFISVVAKTWQKYGYKRGWLRARRATLIQIGLKMGGGSWLWRLLSVSNRTTNIVITFRHGREKADQHNVLTSSAFLISDAYNFKDLKIKPKHHHHIDDLNDQHTYRPCRKWPREPSLPQFVTSRGSCHSPPKGQPRLLYFTQKILPPHPYLLHKEIIPLLQINNLCQKMVPRLMPYFLGSAAPEVKSRFSDPQYLLENEEVFR